MKILLVNKYYYPRGGDCIYTMNLEHLLQSKELQVALFSMKHGKNVKHENSKYWVSTLDYTKKKISNYKESLFRPIYSNEVKQKFTKILDEFNPDIVHLNNIHTQISPLVAEIASKRGKKVVWTLHDYKLVCPSYSCLKDGIPCELCLGNKFNVVRNKCIKGSSIGSIIGYWEAKKWNLSMLQQYTDKFICPSSFLKNLMVKAGGRNDKFEVLHNFIQKNNLIEKPVQKENYFCYLGRLSVEKGIITLLKAISYLPNIHLKIIGTGPLEEELRIKYRSQANIEFLGFKQWEELSEIVKKALFTVIPSEWYENNPLSVLESFSLGTPVIGSRIGGLPEIIIDNYNGFLFEPGNCLDLVDKIKSFYNNPAIYNLCENSLEYVRTKFTSEKYYDNILKIYNGVLNN
jgi:glycosyltransferase involved in cell wall biosynthesis